MIVGCPRWYASLQSAPSSGVMVDVAHLAESLSGCDEPLSPRPVRWPAAGLGGGWARGWQQYRTCSPFAAYHNIQKQDPIKSRSHPNMQASDLAPICQKMGEKNERYWADACTGGRAGLWRGWCSLVSEGIQGSGPDTDKRLGGCTSGWRACCGAMC